MHISTRLFSLLIICAGPVWADFLGPTYPAPADLSSNKSKVAASWECLTSNLTALLGDSSPDLAVAKNLTFSLGMFSLHDPAATKLQFHYTSPQVATSPNGTHKVDQDSIYSIASISKVFTVLAGKLELKPTDWERSLADVFPTLAKYSQQNPGDDDPINTVQWDKITLDALSAQIGGVPRDSFPGAGDLLTLALQKTEDLEKSLTYFVSLGLPPLSMSGLAAAYPPCFLDPTVGGGGCSPDDFVKGVEFSAPTFLPWTTPAYANNGFSLLGLAISNITGKSLHQIYSEAIFEPLGMTSSNTSYPPESEWHRWAIPGEASQFEVVGGNFVSSGGLYSTTSDLAKLGTAILNSTLLPAEQTRRWLKPASHTARLEYSVGRPWEIMRYVHPSSGIVTDMYVKSGESGASTGFFVLLPDFDAGFSILSTSLSDGASQVLASITDLVTDTILPALMEQAAVEAESNYGGIYTSTVQGLNSSLTLSLNKTEGASPGLAITSWITNGTDALAKNLLEPTPYRILPTISDSKNGTVGFRLVNSVAAPSVVVAPGNLFSQFLNEDWTTVGASTYGGLPLTLLTFDVGGDGKAKTVSSTAFKIKLDKKT